MQVNFDTNRPSFGAINYESANATLRTILSAKELQDFKNLVINNAQQNKVDIILFGNGKKLSANICDTPELRENGILTQHTQRFYESGMMFINRMVKKMEKRVPKVEGLLTKQNFNMEA